jgi:hypothetical protein
MMKGEMNYNVTVEYFPTQIKNYRQFTQADLSHTKDHLNFIPEFDLTTGIIEIKEAIREE